MKDFNQGDIIKVNGFKSPFVIVSSNDFIKATKMCHVCPFVEGISAGPIHVQAIASKGLIGTAVCEQLKLIDLAERTCTKMDRLHYPDIMNISDVIQGIFEYD